MMADLFAELLKVFVFSFVKNLGKTLAKKLFSNKKATPASVKRTKGGDSSTGRS